VLSDRTFDDVSGPQDRNRPFTLGGTFRDSELVTLVEFIRSGPEVRVTSGTQTVDRTLAIEHVRRTAEGSVEVYLRINDTADWVATLKPAGETWTLVSVYHLIA
jgi:hypothetical protein